MYLFENANSKGFLTRPDETGSDLNYYSGKLFIELLFESGANTILPEKAGKVVSVAGHLLVDRLPTD